MKALPAVERELRAATCRGSTHWLRLAAAALLGGFWISFLDQSGLASDLGRRLFTTLNTVLFLSIALPGMVHWRLVRRRLGRREFLVLTT